MCYNCGCGMPNYDMGNASNITNKKFELAAQAMGQSREEALRNTRDLIDKVLASKEQKVDKDWRP